MKRSDYVNPLSPLRMLSVPECLAILESTDGKGVPKPFSVIFSTADLERGTGGEIIRIDRAVWHVKAGKVRRDQAAHKPAQSSATPTGARWSRKIRFIESGQIRWLNVHLILEINGHPVK